MDKYLCRKDVYDEIEKAMRDRSHLTQKVITDKNGKQRKVWVRPGENPVADKGKKVEDTTEKQSTKPKYSVGDTVTLDGAKGDFKVSSIDKDGVYHVVSVDGKTGYKVSENHINGAEKVSVGNREMTADNKKISDKLDEITNKLDKEKDPVKRKELLNQMKDIQVNGSKSKHFEQKQETKESETKDYSTMSKDELLSAYNSTKDMDERDKIMAAFDKADKKESKTDLAGAEDKKMYDAYQQMADDEDKAFYESEKKEQYRNQLKEIKKNNPVEYMRFMDQANKDYKTYMDAREKADIVTRSPMFASFPGYSTAKKEVEKWENKYPDFREHGDKHMAYYKFD